MNNARTSAQTRAFKARQIAKQKRDAEQRRLRTTRAAAKEATPAPTTPADDGPVEDPVEPADSSAPAVRPPWRGGKITTR
jgi:hypothetical protein